MGEILVIGYGNTLRSDDGVGPRTADAVAALGVPGVATLTCDLLTPELADCISRASEVFFVDASVEAAREVQARPLQPKATCQIMAHAADPATLLALARDVYGHTPRAWWVTIPVENLEIGEEFSEFARGGMERAIDLIRKHVVLKTAVG